MRVRDLLGQKAASLVAVEPKAELEAAVRLLIERNIGGLPVVAPNGKVLGFLAERDVARAVHEHRGDVRRLRVEDVMRPAPICEGEDSLDDVMRRMTNQRLRHLVVQDDGRVIGVISVGDIVKQRLEQLETEAGVLRDYVTVQRASRF
jgi:CBS domain-containing protein